MATESAQKILSAAEELFATHGFNKVSVRDIAERAEVNKALVFYYYDNKATLLGKVLEGYYREHARALQMPPNCEDVRVGMHELLNRYIDFIEDNTHYLQIVQREIAQGSEGVPAIRRGLQLLYDQVELLLKDVVPAEGPLQAKHFFVSVAGMVTAYFSYAPVLSHLWNANPMSAAHRRERREHLHWLVDTLLDGMSRQAPADE
jgi:TetR/AcrR family transcriptional regulator